MARNAKDIIPATATHPGKLLKAELTERGMDQKDFATTIGVEPSYIKNLIEGNIPINNDLANKLEKSLGIPNQVWINLQNRYDHVIRCHQRDRYIRSQSNIPFHKSTPNILVHGI